MGGIPQGHRQSVGLAVRKRIVQGALDDIAWVVALIFAELERRDLDPTRINWRGLIVMLPIVFTAQAIAGRFSGLYRGRWIFGSFEEVAAVARTVVVAGTVLLCADLVPLTTRRPIAIGAVIGGALAAFLLQGALRYAWRFRLRAMERTRVIVFGAGAGGMQAVHAMLRDEGSPYLPVALIDDDAEKWSLSIMGVKVVGGRPALSDAVVRYGADALLVAVPSADAALVRDLIDLAVPLDLEVRVLPSVRELLGGQVHVADIREPNERDFLGRHQVDTDLEEISHYVKGQVVAVTGAGGSIGSELCRQLAALQPAELIMIDRDESALHAVQLALEGRALLDTPNLVLLDIRDRERVRRLFCERRPDVVFHAAALKHLPLLESHPVEALKTNVWGTLAVLDAAVAADVGTFVNISTDKAANPTSVLGYSKRVAEGLTAWTAHQSSGRYLSVRFGNVLGSRGSVLTAFRAQLASGGPLTVTDPEVTRFFMTVEEAVQLVVQAGAIGGPGEVLVLDMGDPVRIADVARRLIGIAEHPVEIEYTGLRPGEKLHEELFGDGEDDRRDRHELISAVCAPQLDPAAVRDLVPAAPGFDARLLLQSLCDDMLATAYAARPNRDGYSVSA
jgi:FlaA1/EpsC-like NDP-sugar epimerase